MINDNDFALQSFCDPIFDFDINSFLHPSKSVKNAQKKSHRKFQTRKNYSIVPRRSCAYFPTREELESSKDPVKNSDLHFNDISPFFTNGAQHMNLFGRILGEKNPTFIQCLLDGFLKSKYFVNVRNVPKKSISNDLMAAA